MKKILVYGKGDTMKIYILNATSVGFLSSKMLCRELNIKGIISLEKSSANKTSEYYNYEVFCEEHNIDFIGLKSYDMKANQDFLKIKEIEIDLLLVVS